MMSGLMLGSYILLWVLVLAVVALVLLLYRQYGLMMMPATRRIELGGLPVGGGMPALQLQVNGETITLDWRENNSAAAPEATPELVIFAVAGCPICDSLWSEPAFRELPWRRADVRFRWVDGLYGRFPPNRAPDGWVMAVSSNNSAHRAAQIPATPYAYAVDGHGKIRAKGLINGVSDVDQVLVTAFGGASPDENKLPVTQ